MIPNTDPKTGIRYGVIPLRDLEPWFAYEEFYNNSENLAIKEGQLPRPEGHGLPLRKKSRGVRVADSSC